MVLFSTAVGLIFWQTVLLISLYVLLKHYVWEVVLEFIRKEEADRSRAEKAMQQAQRRAEQINKRNNHLIAEANSKGERIIQQALATKSALKEEALLEAKEERKKLLEQAQKQIEEKKECAYAAVREQASSLVVAATKKLIQMELSKEHLRTELINTLLEQSKTEQKKDR